jgi:hypothetical protein
VSGLVRVEHLFQECLQSALAGERELAGHRAQHPLDAGLEALG